MAERGLRKSEINRQQRKEYSEAMQRVNETLRGLFQNETQGWVSDQVTNADGYSIIRGFDFDTQEGTLTVERDGEEIDESITYNFKLSEKEIRKEGYRNPKTSKLFRPIYFTDDPETMNNAERLNPRYLFSPSVRVSLDELRIIERIVSDSSVWGGFASFPALRLPSVNLSR